MKEQTIKATNLCEMMIELESILPQETLKRFENSDKKLVTVNLHHSLGTYIRNNANLWDDKSILHKYFNRYGIKHPDDMSDIILKMYHNYENNKVENIDDVLEVYWNHWKFVCLEESCLPPNIDGCEEKYLNMYNEWLKGKSKN